MIVLTGATGFLGSHLLAGLVERGHRVTVLGRGAAARRVEDRIGDILSWFGIREKCPVEALEADLLKKRCGLNASDYEKLRSCATRVIHCASDTRFSEQCRPANIDCLEQALALAIDCSASRFDYISTAYAVGAASSPCRELPVTATSFHNAYEQSKAEAEAIVAARCLRHSMPYTIIRPSVVYGDSRTGRANRFNGIYHNVRSLWHIREIYAGDLLRHGGTRSRQHGIYFDQDGILILPLRIAVPDPGVVNLIPVDYFVSTALMLLTDERTSGIYHLTSNAPIPVTKLARYCERFLAVRGISITVGDSGQRSHPAEELLNRLIQPYRPYLADHRRFDRTNTDRATDCLQPPDFTYDVFRRCMAYAIATAWGDKPEGGFAPVPEGRILESEGAWEAIPATNPDHI